MRDWATQELNGYASAEGLPEYRIVAAPLFIDGNAGFNQIRRQPFPPSGLPDFAREHISEELKLMDGVGALEALLKQSEIKLSPIGATDVVAYMNGESDEPYQQILALYWGVSPAAIHGVLDHIRTALTQLVAELRAGMADDDELPSPTAANQAVGVVVNGSRHNVQINTSQATGESAGSCVTAKSERPEDDWSLARKVGAAVVGVAGIAAAVFGAIQAF